MPGPDLPGAHPGPMAGDLEALPIKPTGFLKSVQLTGGLPRAATGRILKKQLRETPGGTTA